MLINPFQEIDLFLYFQEMQWERPVACNRLKDKDILFSSLNKGKTTFYTHYGLFGAKFAEFANGYDTESIMLLYNNNVSTTGWWHKPFCSRLI